MARARSAAEGLPREGCLGPSRGPSTDRTAKASLHGAHSGAVSHRWARASPALADPVAIWSK